LLLFDDPVGAGAHLLGHAGHTFGDPRRAALGVLLLAVRLQAVGPISELFSASASSAAMFIRTRVKGKCKGHYYHNRVKPAKNRL
jgi:hypothetical protein